MAQSIPSIPPLITDGINTRIVYAKYRVGVKDAAIAIPAPFTNACYGIVGHLVPESEYLALRGVTSAMPTLVCPHEATPSDRKKFAAEVAAIASFKLALYNSLPCELRSLIGGSGGQSVHELELSTILATLDAKFKALKPADIQCLLTNLCVPYVYPQPLATFVSSHIEIHALLAANGEVVPNASRLQYYREALKPCGLFQDAIRMYDRYNKTPTFDTFAEAMDDEFEAISSRITTSTVGYTVASTASSALAATHHQVAPTSALPTVQLTKAQFKELFDEFSELRRIENKMRSDERKKKQQHKKKQKSDEEKLGLA
jgi:hypothetical protein